MTEIDGVTPRKLVAPDVALPRYEAVERLAETLQRYLFTTDAAKAIAAATVDPAAFRRSLETPFTVRVPGGTLSMVPTRLWAPAVILHPTNTRVSPWLDFPAAGAAARPLSRPIAWGLNVPQLKLAVASRDDVVDVVTDAGARLESENNLDADIAADSVREPITAVVLTIEHTEDEDADPVTVLVAADGSSRVAATHRNLRITPAAAIYRYAANGKALRERVGRTLRLRAQGAGIVDADDVAELNSLTLPAMVVIGFEPDHDSDIDFARAIDARVGSIHVSPPKVWSEPAKLDAQLNAVLDELGERGELNDTFVAYYAGLLTPEEAEAADLTALPDVRAADILSDLHRRALRRAIHDALRSVGLHKVRYANRADIAAEAALRSFRATVTGPEAAAARLLLRHLYQIEILRTDWTVERDRSLTELRTAALAETQVKTGPRPATAELLAYAVFWLARKGLARRATRGKERDRTDIATVVGRMATTQWGIHALYRIVADCRAGRPVQRVDKGGRTLKTDSDVPFEAWIRSIWGAGGRANEVVTPRVQLERARENFEAKLTEAKEAFALVLEPIVDGEPLVETTGVPGPWADRLIAICTDLQGELTYFRKVSQRNSVNKEPGVESSIDLDELPDEL